MNIRHSQCGYALLIMLLVLMGAGGIALAGFTQQAKQDAEDQRYEHNKRVLQRAKQALLMFAYNYPDTNTRGPGRLPCPDHDNDGDVDFPLDCDTVGRLPWLDARLNIADPASTADPLRDASGETLWYAVSDAFDNEPGVVNSDTLGTITLVDRSGGVLYDGAAAGIAAVIIAPGPIVKRDEDDNGTYEFTQLRNTVAQRNDPRNYLDTFNGFDNSVFNNNQSDTNDDGFVLGPIVENDPASAEYGTVVVNDHIAIITADEVIAMAEKKTLEVYRDAINTYLGNTGNQYPWLYNYVGVNNVGDLQDFFPGLDDFTDLTFGVGERVTYLGNRGRVPSMFGDYFVAANTLQPIDTKLDIAFTMTYPTSPTTVDRTGGTGTPFRFNAGASHIFDVRTANILTNVGFSDLGGGNGRLRFTAGTSETFTHTLYFWDRDEVAPSGVFTLCPDDGDQLSDCHRTSWGAPNPGGPNDNREEILRVVLQFQINGVETLDANYTSLPAPGYTSADTNGHARVKNTFSAADFLATTVSISATYEYDEHYHEAPTSFTVLESGTLDVSDLIQGPITVGLRYYPVLPEWAFDNNWHESILMAYAADYRPDVVAGPCTTSVDCLDILNSIAPSADKISLLVIAGQHDWVDEGADGFGNDLLDVFDPENDDANDTFDVRAANGDDTILVIEEL